MNLSFFHVMTFQIPSPFRSFLLSRQRNSMCKVSFFGVPNLSSKRTCDCFGRRPVWTFVTEQFLATSCKSTYFYDFAPHLCDKAPVGQLTGYGFESRAGATLAALLSEPFMRSDVHPFASL